MLNKKKNDRGIKVLRKGTEEVVSVDTLQVGDIAILESGDYIGADGITFEQSGLAVDESSMTGESDAVKKNQSKPFVISGTKVAEGRGKFIITCVGMNSEWGITYRLLRLFALLKV